MPVIENEVTPGAPTPGMPTPGMPTPGMPEPPVSKQSLRMPKKQNETPKPPQDDELVSQMKNGNVKED